MDLEVAASLILADLSAEASEDSQQQRRSRRKKKGPGNFPSHTVQVPSDCNLAHVRLLVHEKTGKRLHRQCLHLINKKASNGVLLELSELYNSTDFSVFIRGQPDNVSDLIMTYKDADFADSDGTRKRPGKIDKELEDSIMSGLTELAFRGMKSDEYDVGKGRKSKKRREERGFRGTFLHSSPSNETNSNDNPDVQDDAASVA